MQNNKDILYLLLDKLNEVNKEQHGHDQASFSLGRSDYYDGKASIIVEAVKRLIEDMSASHSKPF